MKRLIIFMICFTFIIFGTSCDHIHVYKTTVVEPTCTEQGYCEYTCTCGDSYKEDYVDPIGHQYGEWEVVVEPTITTTGRKQKECSICHDTITEEIPKLEHEHTYSEQIVNPTCKEEGYTLYVCECGDSYKDDYVDVIDHIYIIVEVIKEATEEEEGVVLKQCTMCKETVEENTPKIEHQHSYTSTVIEPTCTHAGYTLYTCKCGDSYQDEFVVTPGHDYGEWITVKEPTYEEEGLKEKYCSKCDDVVTFVIPKLEKVDCDITYDLNGGFFDGGFTSLNEIANEFLSDYNKYSGTTATLSNFLKDSTNSIKIALSNSEMISKWQWLFEHMYLDLTNYNTENNNMSVAFVSDTLDLLVKMIDGDTTVIKDGTQGPNFRTLVRSYLHSIMNKSKGDNVNNPTFAQYVPDFSDVDVQMGLLYSQFDLEVVLTKGDSLPIPFKEYHSFIGWQNEDGELVDTALTDGVLTAQWEEIQPVEVINIMNKITELNVYDTYQIKWEFLPEDAANKNVEFISSDTNVATVDENGLITTLSFGTVTITIKSLSGTGVIDTMTFDVVSSGHFDISYETTSYVKINEEIKLNAVYYNKFGQKIDVTWQSLNEDIATVNSCGHAFGVSEGIATIRAICVDDSSKYQDFIVTVVSDEISDALNNVLSGHESNVYVEYGLPIGAGVPVYFADIVGSVSRILYNDALVIDTTYNQATNNKYGDTLKDRVMESIELITVHYTGSMKPTGTARSIASYFAKPLSSVKTSIHYTTGNDGIFKGMDEQYKAAHAGDDGSVETVERFEWRDTSIVVEADDPLFPVVSITKNATFAINGKDTGIQVPIETKFGRGYVTDNKWLNDMGLAVNIKDGKYQLGTAWWCYTQIGEGRICSNGGNRNSIGIEACVNEGSDLWYTWQKTAQLVADIMVRHNLDINRVKGHHFFSAKNCPQPMLENELRLWWEFIELVQAEYQILTNAHGATYTFTSNSDYIDNRGRVIKHDCYSQVVTYTVTINNNGVEEQVTLSSIIEGTYNK